MSTHGGEVLLGHEAAWQVWRGALSSARMHHAWLLAGRQGLGKSSFAEAAALMLVGGEARYQAASPSGRDAGDAPQHVEHADIIRLSHLPKNDAEEKKRAEGKPYEVKRNITIDQIRQMQRRLTTRPTLGDKRAIIIDPADDMEAKAANALLKSLEEPPAGTYFLLISHQPARLLPTIRSRCRVLRFAPLSDEALAKWLADAAPDCSAEARAAAIAAAGGSPGAALAFVEQDLGAISAVLGEIAARGDDDFALRGELTRLVGQRPKPARLKALIVLARNVLARQMHRTSPAEFPRLADAHSRADALERQMPSFNFDPGLFVMEIGGLLAAAAPIRTPGHV